MHSATMLRRIANAFPKGCSVAVAPDLPHLIVAPDVLVGAEGRLLAAFLPRRYEITKPELLLSRLALSRLGLPDNLICVLIAAADEFVPHLRQVLAGHFNSVVPPNQLGALRDILHAKILPSR